MKTILYKSTLIISLILMFIGAQAQSVGYVHVLVSPDHKDWTYQVGEEAKFKVQVYKNQVLLENAEIEYELGPQEFPEIKKSGVILKDGTTVIKGKMNEPGFLVLRVNAVVDGRKYLGKATAGFSPYDIKPTVKEPEDFDEFWAKALAQARKCDLDPILKPLPDKSTSTHDFYEVSFAQINTQRRMYGILTIPKGDGPFPAILEVPGAGTRPYNGVCNKNAIVLQIGIHGFSVTLDPKVYDDVKNAAGKNYWEDNTNDPVKHYYRRVYTGCVRAIDFIFSLDQFDGENVYVGGGSQGGALSITTAALDPRVKAITSYYPALCDHTGYINGRAGGWPHYFKDRKPLADEVETLAYFDVVNFAKRLKCEVWMTLGYNDNICPPTSMFSAYNVITAPKELHVFPETGHWLYPKQGAMRNAWLNKRLAE